MRPVRLRLEGLRSYRGEVTVEFSDVNLVAVVGDTGAGKSSLLEAITYALYGASTWSMQPGDLISDACSTMRVELEFAVNGRRWLARRSMSRTGYPAPVHHLECLDTSERVDGRNEVNKAVTRLLGLDSGAFLQTVLLPQGRFAELLWATGAERNKVLKNIFRVDELEEVREQAKRLHTQLKPKAEMLAHARGLLLPDPTAARSEASKRSKTASKRVKEIEQLAADYAAHTARATEHDTVATTAARALEMLGAVDIDEVPAGLAELTDLDRGYCEQIDAANADLIQVDTALRTHRELLAERAAEHLDGAYLSGVRDELIEVRNQLAALRDNVKRVAASRASVEEQSASLDDLQTKAETARKKAQEATTQHDAVVKGAEQAKQALDRARAALAELRTQTAKRSDAEVAVAVAVNARDAAETAVTTAAAELADVERELTEAKRELDTGTRQHAAAEAAHGTHAGDPCPICDRPLPAGFNPPVAEKLNAARRRVKDAETAERTAREMQADRNAVLAVATSKLETAANAQEAATEACNEQLSIAAAAFGAPHTPASVAAALHDQDDALLASLGGRDAVARVELDSALSRMTVAVAAAQTADTDHERARGSIEETTSRLSGEETAAHQRLTSLVQFGRAIDERFRPDMIILAGDNAFEATAAVDVASPLEKLEAALTRSNELAEQERAREQERERAAAAYQKLADAHTREVATPARVHLEHLDRAFGVIGSAASTLSLAGPPDPPPDRNDLSACSQWARALQTAAEAVVTRAATSKDTAKSSAETARDAAAELLTQAGVNDLAELQARLVDASADVRDAERDRTRAIRQVPMAAELDIRLQRTDAFLNALTCLQAKLADGAFIRDVISRRQRALLGVASTILSEMTYERYGFADDFQIVDRVSGLARIAKTLSGGESFLASLALALAMVEIAGRAGGRLDALFLDEGFGALDNNNLDAALDALESRARAGRLIVVISHVLAVAERVPDVLAVRAGTTGATEVSWLSEADRAGTIDSEISDALSGLLA